MNTGDGKFAKTLNKLLKYNLNKTSIMAFLVFSVEKKNKPAGDKIYYSLRTFDEGFGEFIVYL